MPYDESGGSSSTCENGPAVLLMIPLVPFLSRQRMRPPGEHPRSASADHTSVFLYADEVKPFKNPKGQRWMYIAIVAIPEEKWSGALEMLSQDRQPKAHEGHEGYDGELHFSKITSRREIQLAKLWLNRVMWDQHKCFHFHILGLLLDHLHRPAFGKKGYDQDRRIYNRFFRSSLAYVLHGFFGKYKTVTVRAVFHDKTEMGRDSYFDWHTIWRIQTDYPEIDFSGSRIQFIDSDDRKEKRYPEHSHFVQLTDVILGATKQCLDCTSSRKELIEVAKDFLPLVQRITDSSRRQKHREDYLNLGRIEKARSSVWDG